MTVSKKRFGLASQYTFSCPVCVHEVLLEARLTKSNLATTVEIILDEKESTQRSAAVADAKVKAREAAARRLVLSRPRASSAPDGSAAGVGAAIAKTNASSESSPNPDSNPNPGRLAFFDGRTALHAWHLETTHPSDGRVRRLATDMPEDMQRLCAAFGLSHEPVTLGAPETSRAAAVAGGSVGGVRKKKTF